MNEERRLEFQFQLEIFIIVTHKYHKLDRIVFFFGIKVLQNIDIHVQEKSLFKDILGLLLGQNILTVLYVLRVFHCGLQNVKRPIF